MRAWGGVSSEARNDPDLGRMRLTTAQKGAGMRGNRGSVRGREVKTPKGTCKGSSSPSADAPVIEEYT